MIFRKCDRAQTFPVPGMQYSHSQRQKKRVTVSIYILRLSMTGLLSQLPRDDDSQPSVSKQVGGQMPTKQQDSQRDAIIRQIFSLPTVSHVLKL